MEKCKKQLLSYNNLKIKMEYNERVKKRRIILVLGWLLIIVTVILGWFWFNRFKVEEPGVVVLDLSPTEVPREYKIAFMADIHNDTDSLARALVVAKQEGVDRVVLVGDLTNKGDEKYLLKVKEIMDTSGLKYSAVPGNHEYSLANFRKIFGANYGIVEEDLVKLILIDNSYWRGMNEEQVKWIEEAVAGCKIKTCVAVMHKPLNNLFSSHVMGESNEKAAQQARWLRQLIIDSGVKRVVAGHLHYSSSYELEGIRTDLVGAISVERNTQSPRFMILKISPVEIERKVVEIEYDIGS